MTNLPVLKPRQLLSILQKAGWEMVRQKGSHIQLKHPSKPHHLVTIPCHNKDLARGTLFSIIRQMGFTKKEFEELLYGG